MSIRKEKDTTDPLALIPEELLKELNGLPAATEELKAKELQKKNLPTIIQKAVKRLEDLQVHYKGGKDKIKGQVWKGYLNADPNDPADIDNYKQKVEYEFLIKEQKNYIRKLMVDWQLAGN